MNELEELRATLWNAIKQIDNIVATGKPLKEFKDVTPPKEIKFSPDVLLKEICDYYDISLETLKKHSQRNSIVEKRQVACKILRVYADNGDNKPFETKKIAALLGYETHPTVLHHLKIMECAISGEYSGYDNIAKSYYDIKKKVEAL